MKSNTRNCIVWICIIAIVLLSKVSYGETEFSIDEFVQDCISYNEVIRSEALNLLASDSITGTTKTKILQEIPSQLFQSKPSVELLTNQKITGKNRLRLYGNYVTHEAEILQYYSLIDHPAAKEFVLCNLDYNQNFWVISESTKLFGVEVSYYKVPRDVISNEVIQLNDLVQFITEPRSTFDFPEHYESLLMHCMIQKLTRKRFSWEEAKGIIKDEINKMWDASIPAKNESQERVIQVILHACNDPNITGYERPELFKWDNIMHKK